MADINDENAHKPSSRVGGPLPNSNPTDKESPQKESDAPSAARYHSPEEENELFSTDYVDKLVASFWSKVDQKIETAVSHYQSSPQADRQTNVDNDAQTETTEKEHAQEGKPDKNVRATMSIEKSVPNSFVTKCCLISISDKKTPLSKSHRGVCVYILFIFQVIMCANKNLVLVVRIQDSENRCITPVWTNTKTSRQRLDESLVHS